MAHAFILPGCVDRWKGWANLCLAPFTRWHLAVAKRPIPHSPGKEHPGSQASMAPGGRTLGAGVEQNGEGAAAKKRENATCGETVGKPAEGIAALPRGTKLSRKKLNWGGPSLLRHRNRHDAHPRDVKGSERYGFLATAINFPTVSFASYPGRTTPIHCAGLHVCIW